MHIRIWLPFGKCISVAHDVCLNNSRKPASDGRIAESLFPRALLPPLVEPMSRSFAGPINWFPGHMARAVRNMEERMRTADAVVEVRDARVGQYISLCFI